MFCFSSSIWTGLLEMPRRKLNHGQRNEDSRSMRHERQLWGSFQCFLAGEKNFKMFKECFRSWTSACYHLTSLQTSHDYHRCVACPRARWTKDRTTQENWNHSPIFLQVIIFNQKSINVQHKILTLKGYSSLSVIKQLSKRYNNAQTQTLGHSWTLRAPVEMLRTMVEQSKCNVSPSNSLVNQSRIMSMRRNMRKLVV